MRAGPLVPSRRAIRRWANLISSTQHEHMTSTPILPGSIVVAVDGSDHAARAVTWAAEQAHLENRPLAIVNAAGTGDLRSIAWAGVAGLPTDPLPDLLTSSHAIVDAAVVLVRTLHPDLLVRTHSELGDPRQVLVDLAPDAHLIVMGSRGRGTFRSMLLGSVSASVCKHASCPVVICRPPRHDGADRGIVVGADGSPESRVVIEFAFQQASFRRESLTVLHCFWDVVTAVAGTSGTDLPDDWQQDLRVLLSESVAGLAEKYPDVEVTLQVAHGFVDEALARLAGDWGMVVIGRHPARAMSQLLTGAMCTAVVERAHCTVAVVPEDPASADHGS